MSNIFITVVNMSVTASFAAVFVILARLPLKKSPKIFSYALWAVVLFRMLCPFSFESVLSILPANPETVPQDIVAQVNPRIDSGIIFVDNAVNNILPAPAAVISADGAAHAVDSVNPLQVLAVIGAYAWLFIMILLMSYAVVSYIEIKRRVFTATLVRDNIYETDKIKSPFVLGFIKPRIYLPAGIGETEADYIIKHEQTHIRRGDHIIKLLAFAGLAAHWFNPLMWASYLLMTKDMELSCDESVMKRSSEDIRSGYSAALLSLSVKQSGLPNPLAFGESNVKSRIKNVLGFKKPAFWISAASIILATAVTVALAGNQIRGGGQNITKEESPLMISLGYSIETLEFIRQNKTADVNNTEKVGAILNRLPEHWKGNFYDYFTLETDENGRNNLTIYYEENYVTDMFDNPFVDAISENNALILFASIENLDAISFAGRNIISGIFGGIPSVDDLDDLYNKLSDNLKVSENYFAHAGRIRLGDEPEQVIYRYWETDIIENLPNNLTAYIFEEPGQYAAVFYFENQNGVLNLYATRTVSDSYPVSVLRAESYEDTVAILGPPVTEKSTERGELYISYLLRQDSPGEPEKYAYFVFGENKIRESGWMYGDDYSVLNADYTPSVETPAMDVEFLNEIYSFIAWHHGFYVHMNNDELIPDVGTLYAIWRTYRLETALGAEFEPDEVNFGWKIPEETVKNAVSHLYNLDGNAVQYDDFYMREPGYFWLPDGFSPDIVWAEIKTDTLTIENNIYKFEVIFGEPDDERELRAFSYEFEQVLYKDSFVCYKFIGAARVR